ncbi:MAG: DUF779 domain-containing protein [Actinobacteria bacterium]|nr:DUF779 domain-containing protein [Actinomycetota bacterium]
MPSRVDVTEEAADMLRRLFRDNGRQLLPQSGGRSDGSAPMCYRAGEFIVSEGADVLWGVLDIDEVGEIPVYMSAPQYEYWKHTHLTIDLVVGRGAGFSLETPTGHRFLIRSRLLTDEEYAALEA